MAGAPATDDSSASTTGMRDEDRSLSGESLSEWRSCEQGESESSFTSPPFWDTDCDDDDPGPKPSELYGRYTWRIENFSKEKKREMKSEPFEAGGYKWYILVYPQGCDVSNHLSLFLCVANHDKLLPGWSHFAQFTIAVGNMDPKKIKYSDTLHRFWKKEHDWGWKKFMELSKIQDGFLVDDVLEIIAQVQVIREKVDRPFRCLDRPYRRELLRVYTTNIEQIYRRFVEERRNKLSKLIEDKMRWSNFRAFWSAIDPRTRHRMSREKTDTILKVLVKHFFVEKEVTSTLVMDSLYTGLKALEYQSKGKKGRTKLAELDELPAPMVHVDMDIFVLAGDVITLLERAALEPLPCQPVSPKDDKCSQSRMKDGNSGEVNKISMEREERRLTELGRKILETFVLSHIFSGIEVAYQEAVALKRQEELIREEEAAGLLENETKGKRSGGVNEKDKRAKKKQAKQKKNNRKVKDKERDEKSEAKILERLNDEITIDGSDGLPSKQVEELTTKVVDTSEEGASDGPDNLDSSVLMRQPDYVDRNSRPMNGKRASMESNSSAFSADSTSMNGIHSKGNNLPDSRNHLSPNRGKNQRNKGISIISFAEEDDCLPSSSVTGGSDRNSSGCGTAPKLDRDTVLLTLKDRLRELGQRLHEKNIEGRKLFKAHFEAMESQTKTGGSSSSSSSLEKPPDVLKSPEQSSEVTTANGTANKDVPVANSVLEEVVSGMPATTTTEAVPAKAPAGPKVDPVSNKDHVSSLTPQADRTPPNCSKSTPVDIDKDVPLPSRSSRINRAAPAPPKSPAVDKATPARPKSPVVDKDTPVRPKSPSTDKATPVRPKSPPTDKATPVPPKFLPTDKATPVPPKPLPTDKATPIAPKSPPTVKATSVPPKSPAASKASLVPLKSPAADKSNPVPPKSPSAGKSSLVPPIPLASAKDASLPSRSLQVDKSITVPTRLPQVDKAAPLPSELQQTSSTTRAEAREETTTIKVTSTTVSEVAVTTSRPSSAPVFPTPRSAVPATPQVQVSTLLSRSVSEAAGRSGNDPSPSAPAYVPQTYRNAIIGKPGLGTTSLNFSYQSTTLGQGTALSQPLSTYASTTAVMMPPAGRNDQLSARHGFKIGLGKSDAHDSWQPWKVDSNTNNHLWRDDSPYQRTTSSHGYQQLWKDDAYQQARGTETEKLNRFGGLQPPRQFQSETPVSFVMQQPQAPVAEEYQHLDIINDLLDEEQSSGSMPEPIRHDYHAFGLPFSLRGNLTDSEMASVSSPGRFSRGSLADLEMASVSSPGRFNRGNLADSEMTSVSSPGRFNRGNLADSEMASVSSLGRFRGNLADSEMASLSSPGRFNSTEGYYDEGFSRAYDMSPLQGVRDRQFPSLDTYANGGLSDMNTSKPWLYGPPNPSMSLGVNTNGFPHQVGDYTNLGNGMNGGSVYRRQANGRW